jgi:hypothetical protein
MKSMRGEGSGELARIRSGQVGRLLVRTKQVSRRRACWGGLPRLDRRERVDVLGIIAAHENNAVAGEDGNS